MDELTHLALAARDGDSSALESFVRRSQADVHRTCRFLVSVGHADDLAQETYLRALRSLPAFRAESGARTWLLAIAQRTCADHLRRRGRHTRLVDRLSAACPVEESAGDPALGVALDDLVNGLAPDRRAAFVLTQVIGLGYDETAQVLGCPIGTVRSRVARAREQLAAAVTTARGAAEL